VGGYTGGVDSALKGDLTPLAAQVGKDVVNQVVSNPPPQAQNPVANQPAPTLNKGPKDPNAKDPNALGPDGKDVTGLFPGDDPKDPIVKDLSPNNGKGPKDLTGLPGLVSDTEDSVPVAPGIPVSTNKPPRPAPTVEVAAIAKKAVEDMNKNGNRAYAGGGATTAWAGNIVNNAREMVGVRDPWWKCEDQAPFVANRINQANIPGVRAGVQSSKDHSWVVVNVGGQVDRNGNVHGGKNYYIDPWAVGSDFVKQPATPYTTLWDPGLIRSNIEPDGPK
jgi:hypothetical protein